MNVFGKVQKKIESFKLDMRTSAAAALAHTPCSHQHNVVDHSFLLAVPRVARRLQDPGTFFQTYCAPFVENARSSSAGRYSRTTNLRLQKHWKRKRESPGEINVEGFGQDR